MNINRKSWHAQVYIWWYGHKYGTPDPSSVNLCPYVRVVVFYAPLRALFGGYLNEWFSMGIWVSSLFVIPKVLGYFSYQAKLMVWIIEAALLGLLSLFASVVAIDWYNQREHSLLKRVLRSEEIQILKAYFHAAHDRVCPQLTLQ